MIIVEVAGEGNRRVYCNTRISSDFGLLALARHTHMRILPGITPACAIIISTIITIIIDHRQRGIYDLFSLGRSF